MSKKAKRKAAKHAARLAAAVTRDGTGTALDAGRMRVSYLAEANARAPVLLPTPALNPFQLPKYPPGVLPNGANTLAMDDVENMQINAMFDFGSSLHGMFAEGIGFFGYPYLAELSQRAEYRRAAEVIAEEMTRKWIRLKATGEEDKTDKIKALEAAMKKYKLRETFREAVLQDGFFGRSQIYIDIDLGFAAEPDEDKTVLSLTPQKIMKGSLKRFTVIDPTWTAPNRYSSMDPTKPDFYRPQTWFIMGREVHATRLLTVIGRPLPDILKPAYNFGGLSLSQMMKPYVDNWLRTRQSVSDLINAFTVFNLQTNLQGILQGGTGEDEDRRARIFNDERSNRGLLVTDKTTEDIKWVSAPLGTLDHLQAQSQEQICAVIATPLVKYLGVTPSGLNASADGEIRVFYDGIHASQEKVLGPHVDTALIILQLNEFGEVDPEIEHEWVELWELDEAAKASLRKTNADTDNILANEVGAIDADEVRQRVAAEMGSPYAGLDLSKPAPGPPQAAEGMPGAPGEGGGDGVEGVLTAALSGAGGTDAEGDTGAVIAAALAQPANDDQSTADAIMGALSRRKSLAGALQEALLAADEANKTRDDEALSDEVRAELKRLGFDPDAIAADAEFKEGDHPRDEGGKFTSGSGGGGAAFTKAHMESIPKATHPHNSAQKKIQKVIQQGYAKGMSTGQVIDGIKALYPGFAGYGLGKKWGNTVIAHLEKAGGAAPASKPAGTPPATLAEAKWQDTPKPAAKPPEPLWSGIPSGTLSQKAYQKQIMGTATATGVSNTEKIKNLYEEADGISDPANKAYVQGWIDHLKAAPPASAASSTPGNLPAPHPDSKHQVAVHSIADGFGMPADKIAKIASYPTVQQYPDGYTAKYAKELITALGGDPDAAIAKAKPASVSPAPATTAEKKKAAAKANAPVIKHTDRDVTEWAEAKFAGAAKLSNVHAAGAQAIAPTLKKSFWDSVPADAKAALKSYTGAGSGSMNNVLRGYVQPEDSHAVPQVKAILKMYQRQEAKLTKDVVLRRGLGEFDPKMVPEWKANLAHGIPALYVSKGFVSSSMADNAAFSHHKLIFEMTCRAGMRALGAAAISSHGENELLVNHGQQFEIYEIEEKGHQTVVRMVSGKALED
jgi:uncharacterized protein